MHICITIDITQVIISLTYSDDVGVTGVFGPGGPVLVSDVRCTGTEQKLHLCSMTRSNNHSCDRNSSAGVICSRSFGKYNNKHVSLCWSLKGDYICVCVFTPLQMFPVNVLMNMVLHLRLKT